MWREIRQIIAKLLLLLLPFFILLPLYCRFFPEYYLDEEYAMYKQQHDYVLGQLHTEKTVEDAKILILGDSRTKAGFCPANLWEGSYNLALGGASSIEEYYALEHYLKHHDKPEAVIVAFAPMHYMDVDTLWTRSIYFHCLEQADFEDMVEVAKEFQDTENVLIPNYRREYLAYQLYLPNKYATALKNAGFFMRHRTTEEKYAAMVEFEGHNYYGTADHSNDIDGEAKVDDFKASDVLTAYLERIIKLCKEQGIRIIVEQTPVNETSYGIFTRGFKDHFRAYMNELAAKYPDVEMYTDFYMFEDTYFGDADHLNDKGMARFDAFLMEKYDF